VPEDLPETARPEALAILVTDDRTGLPDLALRATSIRAAIAHAGSAPAHRALAVTERHRPQPGVQVRPGEHQGGRSPPQRRRAEDTVACDGRGTHFGVRMQPALGFRHQPHALKVTSRRICRNPNRNADAANDVGRVKITRALCRWERCDYVCRSASVASRSVAAQETRQRSFCLPCPCRNDTRDSSFGRRPTAGFPSSQIASIRPRSPGGFPPDQPPHSRPHVASTERHHE
jgi:hypothetical protein